MVKGQLKSEKLKEIICCEMIDFISFEKFLKFLCPIYILYKVWNSEQMYYFFICK